MLKTNRHDLKIIKKKIIQLNPAVSAAAKGLQEKTPGGPEEIKVADKTVSASLQLIDRILRSLYQQYLSSSHFSVPFFFACFATIRITGERKVSRPAPFVSDITNITAR